MHYKAAKPPIPIMENKMNIKELKEQLNKNKYNTDLIKEETALISSVVRTESIKKRLPEHHVPTRKSTIGARKARRKPQHKFVPDHRTYTDENKINSDARQIDINIAVKDLNKKAVELIELVEGPINV